MYGGVGWQDAFGEALDHCAGEGEVLVAGVELSAIDFCVARLRKSEERRGEIEGGESSATITGPLKVTDDTNTTSVEWGSGGMGSLPRY